MSFFITQSFDFVAFIRSIDVKALQYKLCLFQAFAVFLNPRLSKISARSSPHPSSRQSLGSCWCWVSGGSTERSSVTQNPSPTATKFTAMPNILLDTHCHTEPAVQVRFTKKLKFVNLGWNFAGIYGYSMLDSTKLANVLKIACKNSAFSGRSKMNLPNF